MYWEYRVRHLDNVEHRGADEQDGVVQAEDGWQAFVKICELIHYELYRSKHSDINKPTVYVTSTDPDREWIGCSNSEEEVRTNVKEGYVHLDTDGDWDIDITLKQVDKNEAYETVKTIGLKRHICSFEIRLPIEKEDPSVDIKCKLKIWVAQEDAIMDHIVDVDFENEKLLYTINWEGKIKPIDDETEYDNIDEVFKIVREFLTSL